MIYSLDFELTTVAIEDSGVLMRSFAARPPAAMEISATASRSARGSLSTCLRLRGRLASRGVRPTLETVALPGIDD